MQRIFVREQGQLLERGDVAFLLSSAVKGENENKNSINSK